MRILAISGSLRAASINSAFCRATARLAPANVHVAVLPGLGNIPAFNQDLEPSPPAAVQSFRAAIQDVKRRLLPQIVQRSYADAKAAFDRKDLREAAARFDALIARRIGGCMPVGDQHSMTQSRHANRAAMICW